MQRKDFYCASNKLEKIKCKFQCLDCKGYGDEQLRYLNLSDEEIEKIKIEGRTPDEHFISEMYEEKQLIDNHISQLILLIELGRFDFIKKSNSFIFLKNKVYEK